jgi:hypothetical protein
MKNQMLLSLGGDVSIGREDFTIPQIAVVYPEIELILKEFTGKNFKLKFFFWNQNFFQNSKHF